MISRLSKNRSVHMYVMPRTVYFGWICSMLMHFSLLTLDWLLNSEVDHESSQKSCNQRKYQMWPWQQTKRLQPPKRTTQLVVFENCLKNSKPNSVIISTRYLTIMRSSRWFLNILATVLSLETLVIFFSLGGFDIAYVHLRKKLISVHEIQKFFPIDCCFCCSSSSWRSNHEQKMFKTNKKMAREQK